MRVWKNPLSAENEAAMNGILMTYRATLKDDFMSIFDEVEGKMLISY
jgi:hypothetical protein